MIDIFISHVEEDQAVAQEMAAELEKAGYQTWYYERDCLPGVPYLEQVVQAVDDAGVVLVLISPASVLSQHLTNEVVKAYEDRKHFLPILFNMDQVTFQKTAPILRQCLGATATISMVGADVSEIMPKLINGLAKMGVESVGIYHQPIGSTALPAPITGTQERTGPSPRKATVDLRSLEIHAATILFGAVWAVIVGPAHDPSNPFETGVIWFPAEIPILLIQTTILSLIGGAFLKAAAWFVGGHKVAYRTAFISVFAYYLICAMIVIITGISIAARGGTLTYTSADVPLTIALVFSGTVMVKACVGTSNRVMIGYWQAWIINVLHLICMAVIVIMVILAAN